MGNLAPEGSVVKATAIDPTLVDADGIYRKEGIARVFVSEKDAIAAIKQGKVKSGEVLVLTGIGPIGTGMEETYQVTSALKHLPFGKHIALLTDARFSGVSTGACIGHIGPEGLAGGPIGKLQDGDIIRILIDRNRMDGSIDLVGEGTRRFSPEEGNAILAKRSPRKDLAPNPALPDDTRLWAALQLASGGTWAGCVYDAERIIRALEVGRSALNRR
jgi:dihydroxyacid dehydratase/phosphogluconate dehydratase